MKKGGSPKERIGGGAQKEASAKQNKHPLEEISANRVAQIFRSLGIKRCLKEIKEYISGKVTYELDTILLVVTLGLMGRKKTALDIDSKFKMFPIRSKIRKLLGANVKDSFPCDATLQYRLPKVDLRSAQRVMEFIFSLIWKRLTPTGNVVAVVDGTCTGHARKLKCKRCLDRHDDSGNLLSRTHCSVIVKDLHTKVILAQEAIMPGEDEVAAAKRALQRVAQQYHVILVMGDCAYLEAPFIRFCKEKLRTDVLVKVKKESFETYDITKETLALAKEMSKNDVLIYDDKEKKCKVWMWDVGNVLLRTLGEPMHSVLVHEEYSETDIRDFIVLCSDAGKRFTAFDMRKHAHGKWGIESCFDTLENDMILEHMFVHDNTGSQVMEMVMCLAYNVILLMTEGICSFIQRNIARKLKITFRQIQDAILSALFMGIHDREPQAQSP